MSIHLPEASALPRRLSRLRWVFEYSDGKARRAGIWDGISGAPIDSAWSVNKTNLARVLIEAEDLYIRPGDVTVMASVPGADYASMQWEAYSKVPLSNSSFTSNSVTPRGVVSGLSIITASEKITVTVDGSITREPLSDYQASFDIHEHKLGS